MPLPSSAPVRALIMLCLLLPRASAQLACPVGMSQAAPAVSCSDLKNVCPSAPTGVYWVQPLTSPTAYQAYCKDGWTAALKIDGRLNTFTYSAGLWTNASLLNDDPAQVREGGSVGAWAHCAAVDTRWGDRFECTECGSVDALCFCRFSLSL